jgi:hypothetical protein
MVSLEIDMKIDFKDMKNMNVPQYCRQLTDGENFPDILEIYRGDMLCLTVDVLGASQLKLVENDKVGPRYEKFSSIDFRKRGQLVDGRVKDAFK